MKARPLANQRQVDRERKGPHHQASCELAAIFNGDGYLAIRRLFCATKKRALARPSLPRLSRGAGTFMVTAPSIGSNAAWISGEPLQLSEGTFRPSLAAGGDMALPGVGNKALLPTY